MITNTIPPVFRSVIAVSVGLFFGAVLTFAVEALGHLVVPPPVGFDPKDPASVAAALARMPTGGYVMLLVAYLVGPGAGAAIAARLAPSQAFRHAAVVSVLFLTGAVLNFTKIPHPTWFIVLSIAVLAAGPFLGARIARRG